MERKTWEVEEFVEGRNNLPRGNLWNAQAGAGGPVTEASLDPAFGTRLEDRRRPDNPMIAVPTSWEDALRLAVQITQIAQAAGIPLPEGVVVKGRRTQ